MYISALRRVVTANVKCIKFNEQASDISVYKTLHLKNKNSVKEFEVLSDKNIKDAGQNRVARFY